MPLPSAPAPVPVAEPTVVAEIAVAAVAASVPLVAELRAAPVAVPARRVRPSRALELPRRLPLGQQLRRLRGAERNADPSQGQAP